MIPEMHSLCTLRDLAAGVIDIVGPKKAGFACGSTPDAVSAWPTGAVVPDDDQLERLLICSELVGLVAESSGKDAARDWLESAQDAILVGNFDDARASARRCADGP